LVLLDAKDQTARMFMIGRKEQFAFLVALLVSALVIGYIAYDPNSRIKNVVSAERLPRPQQVMFMEANAPIEVGDEVFIPGMSVPSAGKIAALPRQSIAVRDAGAATRFLILGRDRYYVALPEGAGQIVQRADIRQLVSN